MDVIIENDKANHDTLTKHWGILILEPWVMLTEELNKYCRELSIKKVLLIRKGYFEKYNIININYMRTILRHYEYDILGNMKTFEK